MNIILLEHIDKVGAKHDVVKVKDGYGRNYLIPQGLGIVANKPNLARLDGMKKVGSKKEAVIIAAFKEVAAKLSGLRIKIAAKAGENGRLFGSVTAQHLSTALGELGVDADKRIIEMPEEVKDLGSYTATIKFHPEVESTVKFEVVNEDKSAPAVVSAPDAGAEDDIEPSEVLAVSDKTDNDEEMDD